MDYSCHVQHLLREIGRGRYAEPGQEPGATEPRDARRFGRPVETQSVPDEGYQPDDYRYCDDDSAADSAQADSVKERKYLAFMKAFSHH